MSRGGAFVRTGTTRHTLPNRFLSCPSLAICVGSASQNHITLSLFEHSIDFTDFRPSASYYYLMYCEGLTHTLVNRICHDLL